MTGSRFAHVAIFLLLCAAAAPGSAQWTDLQQGEEPDPGPRGPYAVLQGGIHDPTGPSLEGFDAGLALSGAVGFRLGSRFGLELAARRAATDLDLDHGTVEVTQTAFVPAMRFHGSIGGVQTEGSFGAGWFRSHANVTDGTSAVTSGQGRLGLLVSMGFTVPLGYGVDLLAGATYAGAYATLYENPTWIAGLNYEAGLRFTLSSGGEGHASR